MDNMEDPTLAYEDMLFFERRLTEVISGMQPKVRKWKALLMLFFLSTAYTAYYWISDPSLKTITFSESLLRHPMFTVCTAILLILFIFFGVHKRVVSPRIIATRCRSVLSDFCLSCDDNGKLIVRPAYSPAVSPTSLTPQSHHSPLMSFVGGSSTSDGALNLVEEEGILVDSPDNRLRTF